ncbi:ubiquitin-conjugating enzyme E2 J1 [Danio aesculapii]|uniref:ubiquitin-conjugating enzyme E2 J1 n=1 Tax=Danio aesculapii TaxID=1142201 RepID=UPI0024C072C1|nr:ubiquitin-conjugating enzyme E2 J1 [Danio aesculapii]
MESKYNLKSPAVKRLMKEAAELRDPTEHYHAQPLEDNLFEWHFSVRGPPDSDFDGGVYHGRIVLPPEYPMKPPSIILLTPNGRFEVGKKICLSISGHHPETWQPSWSIRTALIAIIGFMPTKGEGAIGSLDYTPDERKALAKKSQDFCCEACSSCMRSALLPLSPDSDLRPADPQRLAQQISFKAESSSSAADSGSSSSAAAAVFSSTSESSETADQDTEDTSAAEQTESSSVAPQTSAEDPSVSAAPSPRQRRSQNQSPSPRSPVFPASPAAPHLPQDSSRTGSAVLIVLLTLALAALIFRRIYLAHEYKFDYEL